MRKFYLGLICLLAFAGTARAGAGDVNMICEPGDYKGSDDVDVHICVATSSDGFSIRGDLDVVVINKDNGNKSVNVSCVVSFTPSNEFVAKTYKSGALQIDLNGMNDKDHYIILPQLESASVTNWEVWGKNSCEWTTSDKGSRNLIRLCAVGDDDCYNYWKKP